MNEKIKQLAEQANIHFSRVGILDGDPNGSARMVGYSKMEKFAELIVRECAEQVKNLHANKRISGAEIIREHFGVEE
jgi:hypothetical protein